MKNEQYGPEPLYFYLWWSLKKKKFTWDVPWDPKEYLLFACKCQHESWYGGEADFKTWRYDRVIGAVQNAVDKIKTADELEACEQRRIRYIYTLTLNGLLISMANMTLRETSAHISAAYRIKQSAVDCNGMHWALMQEALLLCDYWTRRLSQSYNEMLNDKNNKEMYMLSGAVRFLCAYRRVWRPQPIPTDMADSYREWYSKEKSLRFKFLLLRVIGLTDWLNDLVAPETDGAGYAQTRFLPYDNMPESWDAFCAEIFRNGNGEKVTCNV